MRPEFCGKDFVVMLVECHGGKKRFLEVCLVAEGREYRGGLLGGQRHLLPRNY